jgi:hypothetical protein
MSDLALGQMPVAYQPLVAVVGQLVGVAAKQGRHFGLDGLRQKRSRAVAQGLGQRVRKSSWLGELEDVSVGLGVSLLQWRSGGFDPPRYAALSPHAVTNFRAYLLVGRLAHE